MSETSNVTNAKTLGSLIKSCRDIMRKDKGLSTDIDRLPMLTWLMFLKFLDDLEPSREAEAKMAGKRFHPSLDPPYRWRDWAARPDGITGDALISFINNDEATRPDGTRGPGLFAYLRSLRSLNGDRRDVIGAVFQGTSNRMLSGYLLRDVINEISGLNFTSTDEIYTLGHLYESMLKEMRDAAGENGEFYTPRPVVQFMVNAINPQLGETILDPACGTGGFLASTFEHLRKQCKTAEDQHRLQQESLFGIEAKPLPYLLCQMNLLLHGLEYPNIDPLNALRFPLREIGEKDRVDVILTNPPFGGEEEKGIQGNFPEDKRTSETALLFLQLIMRKLHRAPAPGRAAVVVPESVMSDTGVAARIRKELIEEFNLHTVVRLPKGVFEPYSDIQTNILFFDRLGATVNTWFYEQAVPEDRQSMRNPCYTRSIPLRFEELKPIIDWWPNREQTRYAWIVPASDIKARGYSFDFRNPHRTQAEKTSPEMLVSRLESPIEKSVLVLSQMKEAINSLKSLDPSSWSNRPLSDILTQSRNEATLYDEVAYKQITVRLYGKGATLRKTVVGAEIRTRPQFLASAGQLIMSRIDARNGAFSLVPPDLDGAVVSQDFPLFDVNSEVVELDFLPVLLHSHSFLEACKRASRGTTNRKRLKETFLLGEVVPLPDKPVQRAIADFVTIVESFNRNVESLKDIAEDSVPYLANFLFS
jgi:type I restriction enzyme M protein